MHFRRLDKIIWNILELKFIFILHLMICDKIIYFTVDGIDQFENMNIIKKKKNYVYRWKIKWI